MKNIENKIWVTNSLFRNKMNEKIKSKYSYLCLVHFDLGIFDMNDWLSTELLSEQIWV